MAFELLKLPYAYDALEPHIDALTMQIHHTKHHQAYVDNINKALEGQEDLLKLSVEDLLKNIDKVPEGSRQAVINHGGGHANHSLFWKIMSANPKSETRNPKGELAEAINSTFGSFEKFIEEFTNKAMGVFGSGWAFLVMTPDKNLILKRHSFQNSPYLQGNIPILGIDVWEHAFYLKFQNRKADYIKAWWNVINWEQVSENFKNASSNR